MNKNRKFKSRESKLWREIVSCSQVWVRFLEGQSQTIVHPLVVTSMMNLETYASMYSVSIYQTKPMCQKVCLAWEKQWGTRYSSCVLGASRVRKTKHVKGGMKKVLTWAMGTKEGTHLLHIWMSVLWKKEAGLGVHITVVQHYYYLPTLCSFSSFLNEIEILKSNTFIWLEEENKFLKEVHDEKSPFHFCYSLFCPTSMANN